MTAAGQPRGLEHALARITERDTGGGAPAERSRELPVPHDC